ncbi:hypothetical protein [Mesorhizobium sp. LNJC405B00]|uniref:hypothetical protein n=1 Tax=Mesorhizobium sp. LNJC405B00 TaxID=1287281 RepID=UPI0003CF0BDC|nr:hypothetical protein [Mesorhizobium sp. LNJC405B00]ESX84589.1 hypothetical protein X755_31765 [Mesorhizobium sp. LNJC405B00]
MTYPEIVAKALLQTLYRTKSDRRLNWKQVADLSAVEASTLILLAQGHTLDMETTARLLDWAGLSGDTSITALERPRIFTEPFSQIATLVYPDCHLADDNRRTMAGTITAIGVRRINAISYLGRGNSVPDRTD